MDVRHAFRRKARQAGAPIEAVEQWLRLARPQAELIPDGGDLPVAGRFGGLPALPEGMEWPDWNSLVLTLDLAALPAGAHDLDLPPDGTLLFFLQPDFYLDTHHITYVPAGVPVAERAAPDRVPVLDPIVLHARSGWDLPEIAMLAPFDLGAADEAREAIEDVMWSLDHPHYEFSIGGYGGNSTGGADYPATEPRQDTVLATIWLREYLAGEVFGPTTLVANFVISHADLAARAFDKAFLAADFNG